MSTLGAVNQRFNLIISFNHKMDSRQALAFIVAYKITKKRKKGCVGEEMGGSAKSIRSSFHTRKSVEVERRTTVLKFYSDVCSVIDRIIGLVVSMSDY